MAFIYDDQIRFFMCSMRVTMRRNRRVMHDFLLAGYSENSGKQNCQAEVLNFYVTYPLKTYLLLHSTNQLMSYKLD